MAKLSEPSCSTVKKRPPPSNTTRSTNLNRGLPRCWYFFEEVILTCSALAICRSADLLATRSLSSPNFANTSFYFLIINPSMSLISPFSVLVYPRTISSWLARMARPPLARTAWGRHIYGKLNTCQRVFWKRWERQPVMADISNIFSTRCSLSLMYVIILRSHVRRPDFECTLLTMIRKGWRDVGVTFVICIDVSFWLHGMSCS